MSCMKVYEKRFENMCTIIQIFGRTESFRELVICHMCFLQFLAPVQDSNPVQGHFLTLT